MRPALTGFKLLILSIMTMALVACGGGGGGGGTTPVSSTTLSGVAAAGAAIVGSVTVKGTMGITKSALIEANGNYTVDVTGLTAPYRLRATGTVGGRTYKLHSYAEAADLGGTVNITPFTDLIIANAAQQIAASFFDSTTTTSIPAADLEAQETALQAKLQDVLSAVGLDSAIDLLNSTFSADHSGLDAALDLVRIEVNTNTNVATITNLLDNSSISDGILDATDTGVLTINRGAVDASLTDTQAIVAMFNNFSTHFASGLPQQAAVQNFFAADFTEEDMGLAAWLTDILTDPTIIGLSFRSIAVSDLDSINGTATVTFYVTTTRGPDLEPIVWFVAKDNTLGWQMRGDQRIADVYFSFHCNDNDGSGVGTGACGVNTQVFDEIFTNNGTVNDAPITSATVSIIDGTDGTSVKGVIYLGTPVNSSAGYVQVYNEANGSFEGDWKAFGTAAGQIPVTTFAAGDIIEYKLYTEALDVSTTASPQIAGGAVAVATYTDALLYDPSTTPLYPTATAATQTAIDNFTLGSSNLTVAWTLAAGTVSDEVLFEISDGMGNRIEIWDASFASTALSTTVASTLTNTAAATAAGLDSAAISYHLLVRIYAADELTGQAHSRDYTATIAGPGAGNGGGDTTPTTLACNHVSGFNDTLGEPINANSFADFEEVVVACGTAQSIVVADISGKVFNDTGDLSTFNSSATGTEASPGTGQFDETATTPGAPIIDFEWYIEDATCTGCTHQYVVTYSNSTIDPINIPAGLSFRETAAVIAITGTPGAVSAQYSFVKYYEESSFGDMVRATGIDGEIWNSLETLQ